MIPLSTSEANCGKNILDESSSQGDDGNGLDDAIQFREFTRLLFLNDGHLEDRMIAVFAAYFDLSTSKRSPVVCMAGYVSSVSKWIEFSRLWKRTINKAGISCFHMTDWVARAKPPFNNPDEAERKRLMRRLISLINKHTEASFSMRLLKADYDELFAEHKTIARSAWQFLTMMNLSAVRQWALKGKKPIPVPIIFDRGDDYSGEFKAGFDYYFTKKPILVGTQWEKEYSLGSLTFGNRCQQIPLQAADVFAWESWRYDSDALTNPSITMRKSYEQLLKGPPRFGKFADKAFLMRSIKKVEQGRQEWVINEVSNHRGQAKQ